MGGGVTEAEIAGMRRRKFEWILKRLVRQKKDENAALTKRMSTSKSAPTSKGMRVLGMARKTGRK